MEPRPSRVVWWTAGLAALYLFAAGALVSYLKRDPAAPRPWTTSVAERHFETVCVRYLHINSGPRERAIQDCSLRLYEELVFKGALLPGPLYVFALSLFLVLGHLGLGAAVIRTSSPLCLTVRKGIGMLKKEPSLLAMPALSSACVGLLLTLVFWKAFGDPRVHVAQDIGRFAWLIVLSPAVLAGYFAAGVFLLLANAVLIHAFLEHAEGREPSIGASTLAAAAIAPAVAAVAVLVFGALLGLRMFVEGVRGWLGRAPGPLSGSSDGLVLGFGGMVFESGVLIASQLVVAAMLRERLSLAAAMKRVSTMIPPRGRAILTAAFGMATMRHEACAIAMVGPAGAGFMTAILLAPELLGYGALASLFLGIACGALYFAFLLALEAVFAAGIFVYGAEGKVMPGFKREELDAFVGRRELAGSAR